MNELIPRRIFKTIQTYRPLISKRVPHRDLYAVSSSRRAFRWRVTRVYGTNVYDGNLLDEDAEDVAAFPGQVLADAKYVTGKTLCAVRIRRVKRETRANQRKQHRRSPGRGVRCHVRGLEIMEGRNENEKHLPVRLDETVEVPCEVWGDRR